MHVTRETVIALLLGSCTLSPALYNNECTSWVRESVTPLHESAPFHYTDLERGVAWAGREILR